MRLLLHDLLSTLTRFVCVLLQLASWLIVRWRAFATWPLLPLSFNAPVSVQMLGVSCHVRFLELFIDALCIHVRIWLQMRGHVAGVITGTV